MKLSPSFLNDLFANLLSAVLFAFLTWLWSHRKIAHMHDHLRDIHKIVDDAVPDCKRESAFVSNPLDKHATVEVVRGGM